MKNDSKFSLQVFALSAIALAMCAPAAFAQKASQSATHLFTQSKPIQGRYIVVFKTVVGEPAVEAASIMRGQGGQVHHIYTRALKGFAATIPDAALPGIRNNPNVDYIEADQTVSLNQVSPQNQATWGLDRIDQLDRPIDTQYYYNYNGAGVHAFIIDTGIRSDHVEFTGRVRSGYNVVADTNGTNDCNGHGTHVSGTVGGTTWGVAKGVSLIPVRVLDCSGSGSYSGVIAGIDWVASSTLRPAVANMSLGGGLSASVNSAVAGAVSKGVTMVVAAGNSNADACKTSPASEPSAITVGATGSDDARASYSNYGSCLDIFAPGSAITSAWYTSASASNTISGTSMAAPHVAGVAALALAANPAATPDAVASFLTGNASANRISSAGTGSPNLLIYSLATGAPEQAVQRTVAVHSITGKSARSGSGWIAFATVTIRDLSTSPPLLLANATVTGSFSSGGTASCVTASTGSCTMKSAVLSRSTAVTVMSVSSVSGMNLTYDSSQNSATQITIAKP